MDTDRETTIRHRAYEIWLAQGRPVGQAMQHWLMAEQEIDSVHDSGEISPAVVSLHIEQDSQKATSENDRLDEGLMETFPASDPVSMTQPRQEQD